MVYSLSVLPSADIIHCRVEDVHEAEGLLWVQAPLKQRHSGRVLLQTPEHNTTRQHRTGDKSSKYKIHAKVQDIKGMDDIRQIPKPFSVSMHSPYLTILTSVNSLPGAPCHNPHACINVLNWFLILVHNLLLPGQVTSSWQLQNTQSYINIKYLSMSFALAGICLPCRGDLDHHLGTLKSNLGSIGLFILYLSSINNHLLGKSNASTSQQNNISAYRIISTL